MRFAALLAAGLTISSLTVAATPPRGTFAVVQARSANGSGYEVKVLDPFLTMAPTHKSPVVAEAVFPEVLDQVVFFLQTGLIGYPVLAHTDGRGNLKVWDSDPSGKRSYVSKTQDVRVIGPGEGGAWVAVVSGKENRISAVEAYGFEPELAPARWLDPAVYGNIEHIQWVDNMEYAVVTPTHFIRVQLVSGAVPKRLEEVPLSKILAPTLQGSLPRVRGFAAGAGVVWFHVEGKVPGISTTNALVLYSSTQGSVRAEIPAPSDLQLLGIDDGGSGDAFVRERRDYKRADIGKLALVLEEPDLFDVARYPLGAFPPSLRVASWSVDHPRNHVAQRIHAPLSNLGHGAAAGNPFLSYTPGASLPPNGFYTKFGNPTPPATGVIDAEPKSKPVPAASEPKRLPDIKNPTEPEDFRALADSQAKKLRLVELPPETTAGAFAMWVRGTSLKYFFDKLSAAELAPFGLKLMDGEPYPLAGKEGTSIKVEDLFKAISRSLKAVSPMTGCGKALSS